MNKIIAVNIRPCIRRGTNLFHILYNRSIGQPYKQDLEKMRPYLWKKYFIANMFRRFGPQMKEIHRLIKKDPIDLNLVTENLQYLEDDGGIDFLTFKNDYVPALDLLPYQNEALQECIDRVDYVTHCRELDEIEASGGCVVS